MSDPELDEGSPRPERRQGSAQGELQSDKSNAAEVLWEVFNLLEEYAPRWYTEQHHDRVVVALHILDKH